MESAAPKTAKCEARTVSSANKAHLLYVKYERMPKGSKERQRAFNAFMKALEDEYSAFIEVFHFLSFGSTL